MSNSAGTVVSGLAAITPLSSAQIAKSGAAEKFLNRPLIEKAIKLPAKIAACGSLVGV